MVEKTALENSNNKDIKSVSEQTQSGKFYRIVRFADLLVRYLDITMKKSDLSRLQGIALHDIALHGGTMTPTELSKVLYRSRHEMTNIIDDLERKGQVKREHSLEDRRSINIIITRQGLNSIKKDSQEGDIWVEMALDSLNDTERECLEQLTEKVYENIELKIEKSRLNS